MNASDLTARADCRKPLLIRDPDGNQIQGYVTQFNLACQVRPLRGGETVMAARMQSRSPAIVTVRASSLSRQITSEWRLFIDGKEYDVKEDPREAGGRAYLEFLAEG